MVYLATQISLFLLLAAALGLFLGWLLRGVSVRSAGTSSAVDGMMLDELRAELGASETERHEQREELLRLREEIARMRVGLGDTPAVADLREQLKAAQHECDSCREEVKGLRAKLAMHEMDAAKPELLEQPSTRPDDLKKIIGVGPKLETTLNELGIYYFRQIANFTSENVAWLDARLRFKGRIERERWIEQARELIEAAGKDEKP